MRDAEKPEFIPEYDGNDMAVAKAINKMNLLISENILEGIKMTAEKSNWNYQALMDGLHVLRSERTHLIQFLGTSETEQVRNLGHTIDFIEYNMRELEITNNNGDY